MCIRDRENRPGLAKEVNKVAEVAGYLWQKGWAERNGGNITVNITEFVDDEIRQMKPISEVKSIGVTLPYLKGCYSVSYTHLRAHETDSYLVCRLLLEKKKKKKNK